MSKAPWTHYTPAVTPKHDWGIFQWKGDGRYWRKDALKVYKHRNAAEKAARIIWDKEPNGNVVVREIFD